MSLYSGTLPRSKACSVYESRNCIMYFAEDRDKACFSLLMELPCTLGVSPFSLMLVIGFLNHFLPLPWRNCNGKQPFLVEKDSVTLVMFIILVLCYDRNSEASVHSSHELSHQQGSVLESCAQVALTDVTYLRENCCLHGLSYTYPHLDVMKLDTVSRSSTSVGMVISVAAVLCKLAGASCTCSSVYITCDPSSLSCS